VYIYALIPGGNMPIYEYRCRDCGKDSEILLRTYNEDSVQCPHCDSRELEKKWSAPGMVKAGDSGCGDVPCCGREQGCDLPKMQCPGGRCGM